MVWVCGHREVHAETKKALNNARPENSPVIPPHTELMYAESFAALEIRNPCLQIDGEYTSMAIT